MGEFIIRARKKRGKVKRATIDGLIQPLKVRVALCRKGLRGFVTSACIAAAGIYREPLGDREN